MKHQTIFGFVLLFAAFALTSTLKAQVDTEVRKANIPFAFYAGEQQFPAGEYLVSSPGGVIHIQNMDGTLQASVMSFRLEAGKTNEHSVLRFNSYGMGVPYLSQIWIAGNDAGRELLKTKAEVEIAKKSSNRRLAMVGLEAGR